MPFTKIQLAPGINAQVSQTTNANGWYASNLVRWRYGQLEKIGGWHSLVATPAAGRIRFMHAYQDLQGNEDLGIGSDGGFQIYQGGVIYTTHPATVTAVSSTGGGGSNSMTSTMGQASVTVTDTNYSPQNGSTVTFVISSVIGGIWMVGGTEVTVTGVDSGAHTWTFDLPSVALTSDGGPYTPWFETPGFPGQTWSYVNFGKAPPNGTITNGGQFVVQQTVVGSDSNQQPIIVPGSYLVGVGESGFSQTNFSIQTNVTQGGTSGAPWEGFEGYSSPQFTLAYTANTYPTSPPNWFIDNLGANMLFCYANGPLYVWQPPLANPVTTSIVPTASQINAGMLTAMPQAQVICFGTETVIGSGIQDPLLIRFSDAGGYTDWTATVSNQAGSYRLSRGSVIVGATQAPQATLVFTDIDLWAMAYVGPPFVYSFTIIGSGCGLIAPHAMATLGPSTYWMGTRAFWMYSGAGVQNIPCSVWDIIFYDIDRANEAKSFCGSIASFNEVFFFYPSLSGGTGECDSYVKFNVSENLWDYGKLVRSAWIDANVIGPPLGADNNYVIQRQEEGYDNDTLPMSGVYVESGYAEISNGADMIFFDQFIPDFKWFGSNGSVNVTVYTKNYPGDQPTQYGPYSITSEGQFLTLRGRARYVAIRYDWAATLGFSARLGTTNLRASPSGKRP